MRLTDVRLTDVRLTNVRLTVVRLTVVLVPFKYVLAGYNIAHRYVSFLSGCMSGIS